MSMAETPEEGAKYAAQCQQQRDQTAFINNRLVPPVPVQKTFHTQYQYHHCQRQTIKYRMEGLVL